MRTKLNYYLKAALFISVLTLSLLVKPGNSSAAEKNAVLDGVKTLHENTVYRYDLNGDGIEETIKYQVTENEEQHTATLKLYIDKKLCLTKKDDGLSFHMYLLDLNKSDNSLDLFIQTSMESDCIKNAFFVQYDGNKITHNIAFKAENMAKNFDIFRYSIVKTDGAGRFTLLLDTPVYSNAAGCYFCYASFQVQDNKISMIPASTFTLEKHSKEYQYKAVKVFTVYSEAGTKKIAYKVKKGEKVTIDKLYIAKTGKVYFRVNNKMGMKGWIVSDQENLFAELPAWG